MDTNAYKLSEWFLVDRGPEEMSLVQTQTGDVLRFENSFEPPLSLLGVPRSEEDVLRILGSGTEASRARALFDRLVETRFLEGTDLPPVPLTEEAPRSVPHLVESRRLDTSATQTTYLIGSVCAPPPPI